MSLVLANITISLIYITISLIYRNFKPVTNYMFKMMADGGLTMWLGKKKKILVKKF
jgi:hypothetical protein